MDNQELENIVPDEQAFTEKKRSRRRLFSFFMILDIALAGYIVYALIMLFTHL